MISNKEINDDLLKESLNSFDDPVLIITNHGDILFSNHACQQFSDFDKVKKQFKVLLNQNKKKSFNHKLEIDNSFYKLVFKWSEKKFVYLVNIEQVQKKKTTENDFFQIVEHAHNVIIRVERSGKIKYINPYGLQLFGYTSDEIIGNNAIGTILSTDSINGAELKDRIDEIWEITKKNKLLEIENTTKDGKRLWISWATRVVKDEQGNIKEYISIGTDRTEKKLIKKKLIASEERFRRMFEQSSLGIYQTTPEGRIIKANTAFAKMFGYKSAKEMIANVNDIPEQLYENPKDRKRLFEILEKKEEKKAILEIRFKKRKGTIFIGNLHVRKVSDSNNNIFYEGYIDDITDRKSAELALQYSRNRYKHLLETMPYGIYELDTQGYITYYNTTLEKMLGYSPGELNCVHINDLMSEHLTKEKTMDFIKSVIEALPKPERFFRKIATKNGKIIDAQIDWDYQYDTNKKVIGFINIISDITKQKAAANALKESENRFRGIYEDSTIGIYRTTTDGEFLLANPAMCSLFGYTSFEEFKNQNASEIYLHPEERISFINEIKNIGFVRGFETKGKKKDGTLLYFRESAHAIKNEKGEIIYLDGIVEDYTEKKVMEQNLIKAKEEAEKADHLKSAFLANMSHEVRTPMNGIMGFSNLLSQRGLSAELQEKYTKIIQSRGEDLLRIINDILDISKLEVSQLKLYNKKFSLNEFMEQLLEIYRQKLKILEKKDLEIRIKLENKDKQYILFGDETRIKQILTNFLDNALKFTEKGYIEFGCTVNENKKIHFYVKDTGIGIPIEMRNVIFQRFRQNDETLVRNYGGNGLGLAICKGLAELMNGEVGVISKEKVGSTFYLDLLPNFADLNDEIINTKNNIKHYWPNKKILIVEDDDIGSALIEEYFQNTKVFIKIAVDGYSALRMIKEDSDFDLVLLDIGLPDISGLEVAKRIKEINPELPIIAQTAFAMKEDELKCRNAGCDDYLYKPIKRKILLEKVSEYL